MNDYPKLLRAIASSEHAKMMLHDVILEGAADEIERLRAALAIIAGEKPSPDNLLGNADIARIALHGK